MVWGYARAADGHGVDIIQNCEVTGFKREGGRVTGVETTRGASDRMNLAKDSSHQVAAAVAGISSALGEQTVTSTALAKSVERIARMTEENGRAAVAVAHEAGRLNQLAALLEAMIARFRLQPLPQ